MCIRDRPEPVKRPAMIPKIGIPMAGGSALLAEMKKRQNKVLFLDLYLGNEEKFSSFSSFFFVFIKKNSNSYFSLIFYKIVKKS